MGRKFWLVMVIIFFIPLMYGKIKFCRKIYAHNDQKTLLLKRTLNKKNIVPIAIIGSGPAGLTAALYGGRAKIHTVVFTGDEPGGQLIGTTDVQNWPAIEKMWGHEIMTCLQKQVRHFGAEIIEDSVVELDLSSWPYRLHTGQDLDIYALTVIIATGARPKKLHIPGEAMYWGRGVSVCALCDAPCFEGKNVIVIGGGDSAVEEALQLAPYAKSVTVLVRSNSMRAAPTMQERLAGFGNIAIEYNVQVEEIVGDDEGVTGVKLVDTNTHERFFKHVDGVFVAIGHSPNTELVKEQLSLDDHGHIVVAPGSQATNKPGVFVAGEVHDAKYRQACVACGYGAMAALDAIEFLRDHNFNEKTEGLLQSRYFHVTMLES